MFTVTKPKKIEKNHIVTLVNPQGIETKIEVGEDEYISDAATRQNVNLPSSCNTGKCVVCTAKLVKGSIVQDHTFLSPKEEKAGFLLTCRTFPRSDCVILTHQEDALFDL